MTQQQIIEKVHGLKTKMDLVNLLNELKREDLGKDCHRFTLNQINFYCNPNRKPNKRYKDFTIPKKSGGVRKISAPKGSYYFLRPLPFVLRPAIIKYFFSFFRRNYKGIIISSKYATINLNIPIFKWDTDRLNFLFYTLFYIT